MAGRLSEATATDCSRLAWLHLSLGDEEAARQIVREGLKKYRGNEYCRNLAERLEIEVEE